MTTPLHFNISIVQRTFLWLSGIVCLFDFSPLCCKSVFTNNEHWFGWVGTASQIKKRAFWLPAVAVVKQRISCRKRKTRTQFFWEHCWILCIFKEEIGRWMLSHLQSTESHSGGLLHQEYLKASKLFHLVDMKVSGITLKAKAKNGGCY